MKTLVSGLKRREEITKSWLIVKLFFKLLLLLLLSLLLLFNIILRTRWRFNIIVDSNTQQV